MQRVNIYIVLTRLSLHKHEVHGGYQAGEGGEVVPLQRFAAEKYYGEECKDNQGDSFLYYFELHQRECASVADETYAVGRYHKAVFCQSYAPRQQYHGIERSVVAYYFHGLELEMPVPCECHKYV